MKFERKEHLCQKGKKDKIRQKEKGEEEEIIEKLYKNCKRKKGKNM